MEECKSIADREATSISAGKNVNITHIPPSSPLCLLYDSSPRSKIESAALISIIIMTVILMHSVSVNRDLISSLHYELEFAVRLMEETKDPVVNAKMTGFYHSQDAKATLSHNRNR